MTETQAKSGAAGASTDADDPSVEAPATSGITTDASGRKSADQAPTTSNAPESPAAPTTPVVVKSQTPIPTIVTTTPAVKVDAGNAGTDAARADSAKTDADKHDSAGRDAVIGDGVKTDGVKTDGRKPDAKPSEPTRASSTVTAGSVPVTAVPAVGSATVAGSGSTTATDGKPKIGPGRLGSPRPVSGKATVAGPSTPVIARASVTTPTPPATTVTGTGLRQTTGATSFVGGVATPTRAGASPATVRANEASRVARAVGAGAHRGPRRARLHLKRIDPWSVMKFSFAVSLVLFVVAIVATAVLYLALDAMHVWSSINGALSQITGQAGSPNDSFRITAKGVIGTAVLLGAVNMVLFTALMTLGAFVYNVCADLVGGIELTLSEKD
jgi:hypothetical protein